MKIISVKLGKATDVGWQFPEVHFKRINLFVGESASGKSIFLDLLFNAALKAAQDKGGIIGYSKIKFEQDSFVYEWEAESRKPDEDKLEFTAETLLKYSADGEPIKLIERKDGVILVNGKSVPSMPKDSSCIYLFREDLEIKPAHRAFCSLLRRDFAADELNKNFHLNVVRKHIFEKFEKLKKRPQDWGEFSLLSVSTRLFLLKKFLPEKYSVVCKTFKSIFNFIEAYDFKDMNDVESGIAYPGHMPAFKLKDKNIDKLLDARDLSSGMKKVLLIITDVVMLPSESLYLIDEYENSLGINAMNFLPSLLSEHGADNQFIVTSHHPYLINAIPVENWIVFHRTGLEISVKQGEQLVESYGKSKQQAFIKLLNDPFFTDGL